MAISLASLRRGAPSQPPRILSYGVHGVGKTSMAVGAPDPVLLRTEDGLGELDVPTFPLLRTVAEVMDALGSLYTEEHTFKSVIMDSMDWLEPLIWHETCRINNWASIEDPGFGKGYIAATQVWRSVLDGFSALRDEKGMAVIFIAHADVKRFEAPDTEPYDRYVIKLQARASALVQEHVDCVFFHGYRTSIIRDQQRGDKKGEGRARGVGGGQRVVHTEERPAFLAKNRYSMPPSIPLPDNPAEGWGAVAQHIPFFNNIPAPAQAAE